MRPSVLLAAALAVSLAVSLAALLGVGCPAPALTPCNTDRDCVNGDACRGGVCDLDPGGSDAGEDEARDAGEDEARDDGEDGVRDAGEEDVVDAGEGASDAGPSDDPDAGGGEPLPLPLDDDTTLLARFDGDVSSVIGDGASIGGPAPAFVPGVVGDAVRLAPGTVLSFDIGVIAPDEGTVEVWLRSRWSPDGVPRTFFTVPARFDDGLLVQIDGAPNLRHMWWGDDPATPGIENDVETGAAAPATGIAAEAWFHLAVTWDAATLTIFVDGVEVARAPRTATTASFTGGQLFVGAEPTGAAAVDADLDELRVSSRARSPDEIAATVALQRP